MTEQLYPTLDDLFHAAANRFVACAQLAIQLYGRFRVSLSGGSTPRGLYTLLASSKFLSQVDWNQVDFFWGDERCVPPEHMDSDFRMARESLFDHLPQGSTYRIFRMKGEITPRMAANEYEEILKKEFASSPNRTFDLLLLGMGEDGHTASLFPGTDPIFETIHWASAHYVQKLQSWRLTLTPPCLNRSETVLFLVSGAAKKDTLQKVLHGPYQPELYPAQIIKPISGDLTWMVDQAASS